MLESASCWYIDWATIGTWVGGGGAAAAAWAAVWAVKHGTQQRTDFAKFLFTKDLARLEEMQRIAEAVSIYLGMYDHHIEAQREEAKRMVADLLSRFSKLTAEYEYFRYSEQQFHFRPESNEFSELSRVAASSVHFPEMCERLLTLMKVKEMAIEHSKEMGRRLELAIRAWAASSHSKQ